MYLYATDISMDGDKEQPVCYRLREPLRLTDESGTRQMVPFREMVGRLARLEHWPATSHKTQRSDPNTCETQTSSPASTINLGVTAPPHRATATPSPLRTTDHPICSR